MKYQISLLKAILPHNYWLTHLKFSTLWKESKATYKNAHTLARSTKKLLRKMRQMENTGREGREGPEWCGYVKRVLRHLPLSPRQRGASNRTRGLPYPLWKSNTPTSTIRIAEDGPQTYLLKSLFMLLWRVFLVTSQVPKGLHFLTMF